MKSSEMKILLVLLVLTNAAMAADPLPSWNDTEPKKEIVAFVEKVTREGSPGFVPVPQRIAVFDNDGTLWCEQPMPVQGANVTGMKLEAFKYYYAPGKDVGVAGICAKPTPELLKLQQDVIAAVAPFTVETGTMAAFVSAHDDPALDAIMIEYVSTFVPKYSGEHFNPHISTGVAPRDYLDKMLAETFEPFTFSLAGASVYQLGAYGTAAKKLKEWDLKP